MQSRCFRKIIHYTSRLKTVPGRIEIPLKIGKLCKYVYSLVQMYSCM